MTVDATSPEMSVDRHSSVPLYVQIANHLERAIASGELIQGSRLPNEITLADKLDVSRPTLRKAIEQLVNQGLVVRRRGSGTVVLPQRVTRQAQVASLFDDLRSARRAPSTRVLSIQDVAAEEPIAQALGLAAGEGVTALERLRFADGHPLAVMINHVPKRYGAFEAAELESSGLYEVLKRRGFSSQVTNQSISARAATAREARLLEVPWTATVLTVDAISFDANGSPLERGSHVYLADRYSFENSVIGNS